MVKKGGDPVPGEEGASVKELYEDFGHTAAALQMLKPSSPEDEYNHLLLSSMQAGSPKDLVNILQEWEAKQPPADASDQSASSKQSARKRKRSDWIMTYNRALALFSSGDAERSTQLCLEKLKPFLEEKQKVTDDFLSIACRTTFLYLEGIMALSVGSHAGLDEIDEQLSSKKLIEWLEGLNLDKEPQHKFLLALYKSRLDCIENDSSGKVDDAKIRSARKELKQAMEIFQHKLRPSGDTGSLGSSSYLEENNGYQQQTPMSPVLQAQNQAALNLKANTEQLKGNIKKSLILCSEAQAASSADDTTYDAIHANNLAIVYQTNGKRHLALHTLAKALRSKSGEVAFGQDGTARPDQMLRILYNAASCAMQAQNFISAYECMATCIRCSAVIGNRPRCWLRAAEACLGLYSKEKKTTSINHFSKIEVRG
jgi:tetratricopeptide (TPR) repeat protein